MAFVTLSPLSSARTYYVDNVHKSKCNTAFADKIG